MENSKVEYVYKLLYSENKENTINEIQGISNSELLHVIVGNYNWDNGLEIPYSIVCNKNCDLGTALMIFYYADGYRVLENSDELNNPNLKQWTNFISEIKERIINNKFQCNRIKFIPPLTKVQIFKLKKNDPNINKVFLEESDGEVIEIPSI
ncbi:DUF4274 domain-containing protein [Clostridium estertheticum]|uniref:DUF4274 domain-containing protein n=1 Tax=Clostridium estertheticum TaxID=238834 RepID=UPI001C0B3920|nr:DUF4274 domain-containing protein [Clostridium estertheticum]MBU3174528.1 DUF4274 domain-containing protein [Clostridium estertheticum]